MKASSWAETSENAGRGRNAHSPQVRGQPDAGCKFWFTRAV